MVDGNIKIARRNACVLGAVGSVLAWDRVGAMIKTLALKILKIPSLRWVDDHFCVEPTGTLEHTKLCFARLVHVLFGPDAIEPAKLEHGNPLTVLGLDVTIEAKHITVWPTPSKVAQWTKVLERIQQTGVMSSGMASKMAGRLKWAAQNQLVVGSVQARFGAKNFAEAQVQIHHYVLRRVWLATCDCGSARGKRQSDVLRSPCAIGNLQQIFDKKR